MTTQQMRTGHGLDRALAAAEWELHSSWRERLGTNTTSTSSHDGAGFIYLISGSAQVTLEDAAERYPDGLELVGGDLVFFPHRMRLQIEVPADAELATYTFRASQRSSPDLEALPAALVVPNFRGSEPGVAGLIENMDCGSNFAPRYARPGDSVICSRIAGTIMLVAVRAWAELNTCASLWSGVVSHPDIARAVDAINRDPGHEWSIQELSRLAMMSRSAFAARFRAALDRSPAAYIAAVRMEAGMRLLSHEGLTVLETAHRLGYESEAGFSRAFRRHVGQPPAQWRRNTLAG